MRRNRTISETNSWLAKRFEIPSQKPNEFHWNDKKPIIKMWSNGWKKGAKDANRNVLPLSEWCATMRNQSSSIKIKLHANHLTGYRLKDPLGWFVCLFVAMAKPISNTFTLHKCAVVIPRRSIVCQTIPPALDTHDRSRPGQSQCKQLWVTWWNVVNVAESIFACGSIIPSSRTVVHRKCHQQDKHHSVCQWKTYVQTTPQSI